MHDYVKDYEALARQLSGESDDMPKVKLRDGWAIVHEARKSALPASGWKLHISATIKTASSILKKVVPYLLRSGVVFKFIHSSQVLAKLDASGMAMSQVGKFMTIYPSDSCHARKLAEHLHELTVSMVGPRVPSDRRLYDDSVVYYRYGAFVEQYTYDDVGFKKMLMQLPNGQVVPDDRAPWYASPDGIVDPFPKKREQHASANAEQGPLGSRYEPVKALSQQPKGGTYLCQDNVRDALCVLKEGRAWTQVDSMGRDVRARLRDERAILQKLSSIKQVPECYDCFTQEDNCYLVLNYIDAVPLRQYVVERLHQGAVLSVAEVKRLFLQVLRVIARAHPCGIINRDVTPNNIMVDAAEGVHIIDWELSCDVGCRATPYDGWTPGYVSQNQRNQGCPSVHDDIFSLGAVLFFLLTSRDPYFSADHSESKLALDRYLELTGAVSAEWLTVLRKALSEDSQCEHYETVQEFIADVESIPGRGQRSDVRRLPADKCSWEEGDICEIVSKVLPDIDAQELRSTTAVGRETVPSNINSGSVGVALLLTDLYEVSGKDKYIAVAQRVARDAMEMTANAAVYVPSLYFGHLGVVLLLARLYRATRERSYLGDAERLLDKSSMRVQYPDLMHGIAGHILLYIMLYAESGECRLIDAAEALYQKLEAHAVDGTEGLLWKFPESALPDLAGHAFYGYAHGSAGIARVLCELFQVTGGEKYKHAVTSAANELLATAIYRDSHVLWPKAPHDESIVSYWCNGAPGIGQFFARAGELYNNQQYIDVASAAANTVMKVSPALLASQCHGIAGNAELLLDLYAITKQVQYLKKARYFGEMLRATCVRKGWLSDGGEEPSPDYMLGTSGVLSFLLRLNHPQMVRTMGLPCLSESLDQVRGGNDVAC